MSMGRSRCRRCAHVLTLAATLESRSAAGTPRSNLDSRSARPYPTGQLRPDGPYRSWSRCPALYLAPGTDRTTGGQPLEAQKKCSDRYHSPKDDASQGFDYETGARLPGSWAWWIQGPRWRVHARPGTRVTSASGSARTRKVARDSSGRRGAAERTWLRALLHLLGSRRSVVLNPAADAARTSRWMPLVGAMRHALNPTNHHWPSADSTVLRIDTTTRRRRRRSTLAARSRLQNPPVPLNVCVGATCVRRRCVRRADSVLSGRRHRSARPALAVPWLLASRGSPQVRSISSLRRRCVMDVLRASGPCPSRAAAAMYPALAQPGGDTGEPRDVRSAASVSGCSTSRSDGRAITVDGVPLMGGLVSPGSALRGRACTWSRSSPTCAVTTGGG